MRQTHALASTKDDARTALAWHLYYTDEAQQTLLFQVAAPAVVALLLALARRISCGKFQLVQLARCRGVCCGLVSRRESQKNRIQKTKKGKQQNKAAACKSCSVIVISMFLSSRACVGDSCDMDVHELERQGALTHLTLAVACAPVLRPYGHN
eukprot:4355015-Amphidinium_carterae.1